MRLYLDTKDLIDALCDVELSETLRGRLVATNSSLVLSWVATRELAAPLRKKNAATNVMALLGKLETYPLEFIADDRIKRLEVEAALAALKERREQKPVDPFVPRLDYASFDGAPPTAGYLNFSIAEMVWELWHSAPQIFDGHSQHFTVYQELMDADRSVQAVPKLQDHFSTVLERIIALYSIDAEGFDLAELSSSILGSGNACPAIRITVALWHRMRTNQQDKPRRSDIGDSAHMVCLPYVDIFTCDRKNREYLAQVLRSCPSLSSAWILGDAHEALTQL